MQQSMILHALWVAWPRGLARALAGPMRARAGPWGSRLPHDFGPASLGRAADWPGPCLAEITTETTKNTHSTQLNHSSIRFTLAGY